MNRVGKMVVPRVWESPLVRRRTPPETCLGSSNSSSGGKRGVVTSGTLGTEHGGFYRILLFYILSIALIGLNGWLPQYG